MSEDPSVEPRVKESGRSTPVRVRGPHEKTVRTVGAELRPRDRLLVPGLLDALRDGWRRLRE